MYSANFLMKSWVKPKSEENIILWYAWICPFENRIQIETFSSIVELDFLCDRWSVSFWQFRSWKRAWSDRSISKTWIFMNLTFDIFDFWSINLLSFWSSSQKNQLNQYRQIFLFYHLPDFWEMKIVFWWFPTSGLILQATFTALTMPRLRMDKIIMWVV